MVFDNHNSMKQNILILLCIGISLVARSQSEDSVITGKVTVIKDNRLDELAKKEAMFNEVLNKAPKAGKGYRLAVLSTNDRNLAMQIRAQLLQRYPDQKVYTSFQPPNIKLRFGDFVEKADAENARKDIAKSKIITGNIYVVADTIEITPEKAADEK